MEPALSWNQRQAAIASLGKSNDSDDGDKKEAV